MFKYTNICTMALFSTAILSVSTSASAVTLTEQGLQFPHIANTGFVPFMTGTVLHQTSNGNQFLSFAEDRVDIMDMTNGQVTRNLFNYKQRGVVVNDDNTIFAAISDSDIFSYATDREGQKTIRNVNFKHLHGFFKQSNKLVATSSSKIVVYDFDKHQILATFNAKADKIIVSSNIVTTYGNYFSVYDINGQLQDTFNVDSEITDAIYTQDGNVLIIATENHDLKFFDAKNNYEELTFDGYDNTAYVSELTFDRTGQYLAFYQHNPLEYQYRSFRLYDFQEGQRIYSNLDAISNQAFKFYDTTDIALSPQAKYILINNRTYSAKDIRQYVTDIEIPYDSLSVGQTIIPKVIATLADGTKQEVATAVSYRPSDLDLAYINNKGKLFAAESGTITLSAAYLGFSTEKTISIKPNPEFSYINDYIENYIQIYDNTGDLSKAYLDQRIYKNNQYKGNFTATIYTGYDQNKAIARYSFALKTTKKIGYSKVKFTANGKTLTTKVKTDYYSSSNLEIADSKKLSAKELKWFKTNINENKKVTVQFVGKSKKMTKTLTKNQKRALKDAVLLNAYLGENK